MASRAGVVQGREGTCSQNEALSTDRLSRTVWNRQENEEMTGHIRRRGEHSWELKFDDGRDPATGRRVIRYHAYKGTKRDAQIKLTELLKARDDGAYVEHSKLTVAEQVRALVDQ